MSAFAIALVLSAAVCHAAWNIVAHGSSGSGLPFLWWGAVIASGLWAFAIPFTDGLEGADPWAFLIGAAVSGVLHVGYMLALQRGYASGDLTTVYATARGSGPILTGLFALLVLGERPGPLAIVGALVVVLGVIAVGAIGRPRTPLRTRPIRRRGIPSEVVWGVLTGVAIAGYTVWDAIAMNRVGLPAVAYFVGFTVTEVLGFSLLLLRRRDEGPSLGAVVRTQWGRLLAFGVLSPLSYILVLTATKIAPIALIAPMREVSVILVSLYGVWRFRQDRAVLRIGAAGVVVVGIALIGSA
ncbi:EamA family transporter [Leucobacter sp. HNU]|uniref:EamA family transporter n=1 Tax=Leucobacter sp. HNU TaxID=3236805 RepID=UPI003A800190